MTFGLIDRKNHEIYTYMGEVFEAIDNAQNQYNWLVADCECYPESKKFEQLFSQEYCWLSGKELSEIVVQEEFQWIWGVLCGFEKHITLEEVLKYPLPSARDYNGYYQNPVSVQHPLSSVEIAPSDSSWIVIVSKDKRIVDNYLKRYPKTEELSVYNQK